MVLSLLFLAQNGSAFALCYSWRKTAVPSRFVIPGAKRRCLCALLFLAQNGFAFALLLFLAQNGFAFALKIRYFFKLSRAAHRLSSGFA